MGVPFIYNALEVSEHSLGIAMKILRLSEVNHWPGPRELTPEELAEAYALAKAAFTAEDLQCYTEIDEGIPAEDFLRELAEAQRQFDQGSP